MSENWWKLPWVLGEQLAKELECYFAEVAAAEQVSSIADAFTELGREVHVARRRSKPPPTTTHSLLDRMLGNRSSSSIGIRAYARGKSDSALPKEWLVETEKWTQHQRWNRCNSSYGLTLLQALRLHVLFRVASSKDAMYRLVEEGWHTYVNFKEDLEKISNILFFNVMTKIRCKNELKKAKKKTN